MTKRLTLNAEKRKTIADVFKAHWESESIIDDLDFYIPLDLKIKPTTKRKKHGKRKTILCN